MARERILTIDGLTWFGRHEPIERLSSMSEWWDKQIQRADYLAPRANGSKELLNFYAHLLRAQKDIYEFLRSRKDWLPSGELESDLPVLQGALPGFLKVVQSHGPTSLAAEAGELLET